MSDLDNSTDSDDSSSILESEISNNITMAQSIIDALQIIESIKGEHKQLAVSIIKTKLKGVARNLIGNETTITKDISRLKSNVKGETVEVLSAKLMNL